MDLKVKDELPDARFWTTYDRFMIEREARAIRRRELRALTTALWGKAKTRLSHYFRHAGAQPVKTHGRTA